jgi:hypothetical protein
MCALAPGKQLPKCHISVAKKRRRLTRLIDDHARDPEQRHEPREDMQPDAVSVATGRFLTRITENTRILVQAEGRRV